MPRSALGVSLCLFLAACGDGRDLDFDDESPGGGSIGEVQGVPLEVRDELGLVDSFEHQGSKYATFRAALTDREGICSQFQEEHTIPGDAVVLAMQVQKHDLAQQPPPIQPGRYDIGTSIDDEGHLQEVVARFSATDEECQEQIVQNGLADEGTITIDEIATARARGSFTLRFGADALNGSFDVALCAVELPVQATCAHGP
jgi:hypothetical protein